MWLTALDILVPMLNIYSSFIGYKKKLVRRVSGEGFGLHQLNKDLLKIRSILTDFYLSHVRTEVVHLDKPSFIQHGPFYTVMTPSQ